MTDDEILAEFRAAEALLDGHFILSSGRRSPRYLQCARVLADPLRASRLAQALVSRLPREIRKSIDVVVSPAMGGVIIGHEMGRALGVEALFVEHIRRAKRFIYAESQYFASRAVAEAIAQKMAEPDPPEIVLINPESAEFHGVRAHLLGGLNRWQEALEIVEQAIYSLSDSISAIARDIDSPFGAVRPRSMWPRASASRSSRASNISCTRRCGSAPSTRPWAPAVL